MPSRWPSAIFNRKMYEFLSGKVIQKEPGRLVLEVGGIGYDLIIPLSTFNALPEPGSPVKVWTHFQVREDAHQLFGFSSEEERTLFRLLLSVNGIGPKMGASILSGIGLAELQQAIVEGSIATLTSVSGIGRKTAERLVVELREKILLLPPKSKAPASVRVEDSLQALLSLGYRRPEAKRALQRVVEEKKGNGFSVEELVRASLKYIS